MKEMKILLPFYLILMLHRVNGGGYKNLYIKKMVLPPSRHTQVNYFIT